MMWNLMQAQAALAVFGERTDIKQYTILTIIAGVLIVLCIVLKLITKKKK